MKHLAFTDKVRTLLAQRNFAFVVVVFLMGVNILALIALTTRHERIIVVPSLNTDSKQYIFEGSQRHRQVNRYFPVCHFLTN